ncbi:chemotaxis protein CheW [Leptolyngbya sp. FACHB-261]|uniref:chemotaxis protein CheW n=1 Tax=Leptolyngbya sp. FACHB-261 TaxID=2692806 RepID=UPI00168613BE|nr:chemotaxis protein CheW [Leptolyngbya sp. FACHB-261]MBD2101692.1 chemotaxis protein CheW [Leptolyngbya sp. FACHB-261]
MHKSTLLPALNRSQRALGESYLKFQLAPNTPAVLRMEQVQEALVIPVQRLTPMPNMPPCVLGLLNRRSRVLWAVDLAQLLQLPPLETYQRYSVVIVHAGQTPLGLLVQEVKGVARFSTDCIQPLRSATAHLEMYSRGYISQPTEEILVLDAEPIIHSPLLSHA